MPLALNCAFAIDLLDQTGQVVVDFASEDGNDGASARSSDKALLLTFERTGDAERVERRWRPAHGQAGFEGVPRHHAGRCQREDGKRPKTNQSSSLGLPPLRVYGPFPCGFIITTRRPISRGYFQKIFMIFTRMITPAYCLTIPASPNSPMMANVAGRKASSVSRFVKRCSVRRCTGNRDPVGEKQGAKAVDPRYARRCPAARRSGRRAP